jgi:hypothetical protein
VKLLDDNSRDSELVLVSLLLLRRTKHRMPITATKIAIKPPRIIIAMTSGDNDVDDDVDSAESDGVCDNIVVLDVIAIRSVVAVEIVVGDVVDVEILVAIMGVVVIIVVDGDDDDNDVFGADVVGVVVVVVVASVVVVVAGALVVVVAVRIAVVVLVVVVVVVVVVGCSHPTIDSSRQLNRPSLMSHD